MEEAYRKEVEAQIHIFESKLESIEEITELNVCEDAMNALNEAISQYGAEMRVRRNKKEKQMMKDNLELYKRKARDFKLTLDNHRSLKKRDDLFGNVGSEGDEEEQLLERSNESLYNSRRKIGDILESGTEIGEQLKKNRETIENANRRVKVTHSAASEAIELVNSMLSRENRRKSVLKIAYSVVALTLFYLLFSSIL